MNTADRGLPPDQRARLAEKGRRLYRKSCGKEGDQSCAESFALFHLGRGAAEVALDLVAFLEAEAENLRTADPDGRMASTLDMAARIRRHLALRLERQPGS